DAGLGGGGGGDDQDAVLQGGGDDALGLTGEDAAQGHVHAVVHQHAVGGDGGVGVALGVLGVQLKGVAVDAAGLIDLIHSDLRAVAGGGAVVGVVAGHGADQAQQQGLVAVSGVGVGAGIGAGVGGSVRAGVGAGVGVRAGLLTGRAGGQTEDQGQAEHQAQELGQFLHFHYLVFSNFYFQPFGSKYQKEKRPCRGAAKPVSNFPPRWQRVTITDLPAG